MSDKKDVKFVNGLFVNLPREGAPDFIKMSISIKRADLGNWLRAEKDEWINIDVKESKAGKLYAAVNDWKPEKKAEPKPDGGSDFVDDNPEDLSF